MKDFTLKADNVSTISAEDLNATFNELENAVTSSGQALSGGDLSQLAKAMSHYASQATWYACSGSANAYILTAPTTVSGTTSYVSGQVIQFQVNVANTGASTVNVAGLGTKNIVGYDGSTPLSSGTLPLNGIATAYYDGTVFRLISVGFSSSPSVSATVLARSAPCGRLTLASNTPYTFSNVTGSTLYYTPAYGNAMSLWNGLAWQGASLASEASIALPATTNTMYDVFAYASSGNVALELVAWTSSNTVRGAALTSFQGALVKSSDYTRLYVGSVATGSVSGQSADTFSERLVFNYRSDVRATASCSTSASRIGSAAVCASIYGVLTVTPGPDYWPSMTTPGYFTSSGPVIGQDSVRMVVGVDSRIRISHTVTVADNGQRMNSYLAQVTYASAVCIDTPSAIIDTTLTNCAVGTYDNTACVDNAHRVGDASVTAGLRTFSSLVWRSSPLLRNQGGSGFGNSHGHQLSVTLL